MDNALGAAIRALEEVVAPAIDPADPLAAEQLVLVIDSLRFLRERLDHLHDRARQFVLVTLARPSLRERLDHLHDRARFDLRHHLTLARAIAEDVALEDE